MSLANGLVSPLTSAPALAGQYIGAGSGGVASITAGNATAVITGTPTNPIISSYAGSSTSDPAVFLGTPISATTSGAFVAFPGTTQAVTPGDYWLVSGQLSIASTTNVAGQQMLIFLKFDNAVVQFVLYEGQESTTTYNGSFGFVVKVPAGASNFDINVSRTAGAGSVTGGLQALNYTKLNLI